MPTPITPRRNAGDDLVLPTERIHATRRSFLRMAGFGIAAATLAACERAPVRLVVPRLDETAGPLPGHRYRIATTCGGCAARCGVLATCRDGRPVKLEGNPDHALSRGGLCAVGQAALIELYDARRIDGARVAGAAATWEAADQRVRAQLLQAGAGVRVLSGTVTSPSTRAFIDRLVKQTGGRHVEWDSALDSALLDAHEACLGVRSAPHVRLERARVIAGFDADFLGASASPVEHARGWRAGRDPDASPPRMSRHVQFEPRLSLTGSKADDRYVLAPWHMRAALGELCRVLARLSGTSIDLPADAPPEAIATSIAALASELWDARRECVVLCGSDDTAAQALALLANQMLGSYGATLSLERPSLTRRGSDAALRELIGDMRDGRVQLLIVHDLNPLYDLPESLGFREALGRVGLVVSTSPEPDETAAVAHVQVPVPHALSSWDDAEPVAGHLSLVQPTVPPLRAARTLRASIAAWLGDARGDDELLRDHWRVEVFPRSGATAAFDAWFDGVLLAGHLDLEPVAKTPAPRLSPAAVTALLERTEGPRAPAAGGLALVLHRSVTVPDGRHAHNPWLQELPDPLTKITWDNVAAIGPATAARLGVSDGDTLRITGGDGVSVELPASIQPGQHEDVVAVALGYGRAGTDRFARIGPSWLEGRLTVREGGTVGSRAADLITSDGPTLRAVGAAVEVARTGGRSDLACTQDHHRLEVPPNVAPPRGKLREPVLGATLAAFAADGSKAIHAHEPESHGLWPDDHPHTRERWGMVIDLSACIGCSGCSVACQAENNVPVVGKDEVRRHREMTWLRIDRYFHGEGDDLEVSHQPLMCQHCANAPCETVCPVLATVHSEDGLNQQIYNRCVGTRYCANNCPYKTRRFNWFDYPRAEELRNLALNPDVTVRTRGVMEKCSMCVQRIQEGRAEAARRGAPLVDGEVRTACQQSCPTDAIAFGDLNDKESAVARRAASERAYAVLGELNVRPGVTYLAEIRNTKRGRRHE